MLHTTIQAWREHVSVDWPLKGCMAALAMKSADPIHECRDGELKEAEIGAARAVATVASISINLLVYLSQPSGTVLFLDAARQELNQSVPKMGENFRPLNSFIDDPPIYSSSR